LETSVTQYNSQDIYVLNPDVRLRNDKKRVIAIAFHDGSAYPLALDPITGVVMSMFDGLRTCEDIADLCTSFANEPIKMTEEYVEKVIIDATKTTDAMPLPLLVMKRDLRPEDCRRVRKYNPRDFAIHRDQWKALYLDNNRHVFPVGILWLLTNDCQVNCQYCYMHKPPLNQEDLLPWDRVQTILKEIYEHGPALFNISGGDVMLYPHIFDLLDLLRQYDLPIVGIPTKAYVGRETADRLAKNDSVNFIQFSIDSTVPEIGDYLVQSPGFVERTFKSIENCLAAGLKVESKSVITPYNITTIPKLYRELKARGVSAIRLATYCRSTFHHKDKFFNHLDDYEWLYREIEKLKQEFPGDTIRIQNGSPTPEPMSPEKKKEIWDKKTRCTAGRNWITICANGRVVACEQIPEREEDYLGNLRSQSLTEVWNSKALDEYLIHPPREKFKGTICYECPEDEFYECTTKVGTCVRDIVRDYGTRWAPTKYCPRAPEAPRPQ
jgi:radical SAM protein with 4Fe4S-binding SPASM domain